MAWDVDGFVEGIRATLVRGMVAAPPVAPPEIVTDPTPMPAALAAKVSRRRRRRLRGKGRAG